MPGVVDVEALADDELVDLRKRVEAEVIRRGKAEILWPPATFTAAHEVFGDVVYGEGRTRKALTTRIRHAQKVWDEKYGPLNPRQEAYADDVLAAAIRSAGSWAKDAGIQPPNAPVLHRLGTVVNHERVHEGFLARADVRRRSVSTAGVFEDAA